MEMFGTFPEWKRYVCEAITVIFTGVYKIGYAIAVGLASLLFGLWRILVRLVGKYPSLALGGFLVAVLMTWLFTFMAMRARAVGAEAQRDSIAWKYTEFKEYHGFE